METQKKNFTLRETLDRRRREGANEQIYVPQFFLWFLSKKNLMKNCYKKKKTIMSCVCMSSFLLKRLCVCVSVCMYVFFVSEWAYDWWWHCCFVRQLVLPKLSFQHVSFVFSDLFVLLLLLASSFVLYNK